MSVTVWPTIAFLYATRCIGPGFIGPVRWFQFLKDLTGYLWSFRCVDKTYPDNKLTSNELICIDQCSKKVFITKVDLPRKYVL